jgi:hypothetical protein
VQPNRPNFLVYVVLSSDRHEGKLTGVSSYSADPVFQGIVDKLVPEFAEREVDERRAFYERHGFVRKATNGPRGAATEPLANGHLAEQADAAHADTPSKPVEKIRFDLLPQNGYVPQGSKKDWQSTVHAEVVWLLCRPGIPLFLHLAKLRQPRMRTDASFRVRATTFHTEWVYLTGF